MADVCCEGGHDVMILAFSGGSNVGQLSNQAAVESALEGFGFDWGLLLEVWPCG